MDIHQYHQNRILVQYVFMKLKNKVERLQEEDLTSYFNEKGWFMYDLDIMSRDIRNWKSLQIKKTRIIRKGKAFQKAVP